MQNQFLYLGDGFFEKLNVSRATAGFCCTLTATALCRKHTLPQNTASNWVLRCEESALGHFTVLRSASAAICWASSISKSCYQQAERRRKVRKDGKCRRRGGEAAKWIGGRRKGGEEGRGSQTKQEDEERDGTKTRHLGAEEGFE